MLVLAGEARIGNINNDIKSPARVAQSSRLRWGSYCLNRRNGRGVALGKVKWKQNPFERKVTQLSFCFRQVLSHLEYRHQADDQRVIDIAYSRRRPGRALRLIALDPGLHGTA